MDIILLNKNCVIFNKPLDIANTIFINTRLHNILINKFIDEILPILTKPIILIISGEDYTFPNNTDKRMITRNNRINQYKNLGKHKMILKMFVENLDEDIYNAESIPLGLNSNTCETNLKYYLNHQIINTSKPLLVTNFNICRNNGKGQWNERKFVFKMCNSHWKINCVNNPLITNYEKYLKTLGSYMFTVCVHGGGLDVNPKVWESLLIGVIPIIRENKPYTDLYIKHDLPVVIVNNWEKNTICAEKLYEWYTIYYDYFTNKDKREILLNKLTLNYWVEYICKDNTLTL